MPSLAAIRKSIAKNVTGPVVRLIARTPLTPNAITWLGFSITVVAGGLAAARYFIAAGIVTLVAGLFDMLDGALARATNRTTRFGAVLDSTLDRVSESVLLVCLLSVFARDGMAAESILAGAALAGSLIVSYVRAKIEAMNIECKAGFFTRPERVIILALGMFLSGFANAFLITIAIITFFSWLTVIERTAYAWRKLRE